MNCSVKDRCCSGSRQEKALKPHHKSDKFENSSNNRLYIVSPGRPGLCAASVTVTGVTFGVTVALTLISSSSLGEKQWLLFQFEQFLYIFSFWIFGS